jgi:hypothetical protein
MRKSNKLKDSANLIEHGLVHKMGLSSISD